MKAYLIFYLLWREDGTKCVSESGRRVLDIVFPTENEELTHTLRLLQPWIPWNVKRLKNSFSSVLWRISALKGRKGTLLVSKAPQFYSYQLRTQLWSNENFILSCKLNLKKKYSSKNILRDIEANFNLLNVSTIM